MALLFDITGFPVISVLDTEGLQPIRREALALDSVDTPISMPTAVELSIDGRIVYTVNAASDVALVQGTGASTWSSGSG